MDGDGPWILGAGFMKSVYTVFDMAESRIGFATPVNPNPQVSSTSQLASATPRRASKRPRIDSLPSSRIH